MIRNKKKSTHFIRTYLLKHDLFSSYYSKQTKKKNKQTYCYLKKPKHVEEIKLLYKQTKHMEPFKNVNQNIIETY